MTHSTPQTRHPAVGRCSDTGISLSMSTLFCMCLKLFSKCTPRGCEHRGRGTSGGRGERKEANKVPKSKNQTFFERLSAIPDGDAGEYCKGWRS